MGAKHKGGRAALILALLAFLVAFPAQGAFAAHGFEVFLDNNHSPRNRIAATNSVVDFNFTIKSDWNSALDINKVRIAVPSDYNVLDVNAIGWGAVKPVGDWNSLNPVVLMPFAQSYNVKPDSNAVFQLRVSVPSGYGASTWSVSAMDTNDSDYSQSRDAHILAIRKGATADLGFDIRNEFGGAVKNATVTLTNCTGSCPTSTKNDSNSTGLVIFTSPTEISLVTGNLYDFNVTKNGFVTHSKQSVIYSDTSLNDSRADLNFSVKVMAASDELGNAMDVNQNRVTVSCSACQVLPTYFKGFAYFDTNQVVSSAYTASRAGFVNSSTAEFSASSIANRLLYFDTAIHTGARDVDTNELKYSLKVIVRDQLGNAMDVNADNVWFDYNGVQRGSDANSGSSAYFAVLPATDVNVSAKRDGFADKNSLHVDTNSSAQAARTVDLNYSVSVLGARDELDLITSGISLNNLADTNFLWNGGTSAILAARFDSNRAFLAISNRSTTDANLTLRKQGFLDSNVLVRVSKEDSNSAEFDSNGLVFGAIARGPALRFALKVVGATSELSSPLAMNDSNTAFLWDGNALAIPRRVFVASGADVNVFLATPAQSKSLTLRHNGFADKNNSVDSNNISQAVTSFSGVQYSYKVVRPTNEAGALLSFGSSASALCNSPCTSSPAYSDNNAYFDMNVPAAFTISAQGYVTTSSGVLDWNHDAQQLVYFDLNSHNGTSDHDSNGLPFTVRVRVKDQFGADLNIDSNRVSYDLNSASRSPDYNNGLYAYFALFNGTSATIRGKAQGFIDTNGSTITVTSAAQTDLNILLPYSLLLTAYNELGSPMAANSLSYKVKSIARDANVLSDRNAYFAIAPTSGVTLTASKTGYVDTNSTPALVDVNSSSQAVVSLAQLYAMRLQVRDQLGIAFSVDSNGLVFDLNGVERGSDANFGNYAYFALVPVNDMNVGAKKQGFIDANAFLVDINAGSQAQPTIDLNYVVRVAGMTTELGKNISPYFSDSNTAFLWNGSASNITFHRYSGSNAYLGIPNWAPSTGTLTLRERGFVDSDANVALTRYDQNRLAYDQNRDTLSPFAGTGIAAENHWLSLKFPLRVQAASTELGISVLLHDSNSALLLSGMTLLEQNFTNGIGYASAAPTGSGTLTLRQAGFVDKSVPVIATNSSRFDTNFTDANALAYSVKIVSASDELGHDMNLNPQSQIALIDRNVQVSCISCQGYPTYSSGKVYFNSRAAGTYTAGTRGFIDKNAVAVVPAYDKGQWVYFDANAHSGTSDSNAVNAGGLQYSVRLQARDQLGSDINVSSLGASFDVNGVPRQADKNNNSYAYFALSEFSDHNITSHVSGWVDTNRNAVRPNHDSQGQYSIGMPFAAKVLGMRDELDYNALLAQADTNFYWAGSDSNVLRVSFDSNFAYVAVKNDSLRDSNFTIRQRGFLDSNVFLRLQPTDQNTISFDNNAPAGYFGAKAVGNALSYNTLVLGATDQFDSNVLLRDSDSNFFWNYLPVVAYRVKADTNQAYVASSQFSGLSGFLYLRQRGFADQNVALTLSFSSRATTDFDSNSPGKFSGPFDGNGLLYPLRVKAMDELGRDLNASSLSFRAKSAAISPIAIDSNSYAFLKIDLDTNTNATAGLAGYVDTNTIDLNRAAQTTATVSMPIQIKARVVTTGGSNIDGAVIQILNPSNSTVADVNGIGTWITPYPSALAPSGYAYIAVDPSQDDNQTLTMSVQASGYSASTLSFSSALSSGDQNFVTISMSAIPPGEGDGNPPDGGGPGGGGPGGGGQGGSSITLLNPSSSSPVQRQRGSSLSFSYGYSSYCPNYYLFFLSDPQTGSRACSSQADLGWVVTSLSPFACENRSGTTSGTGSCAISSDANLASYNATIELHGQSGELLASSSQASAVSVYANSADLELERFDSNSADLNSAIDLNASVKNSGDRNVSVQFAVSLYKNSIDPLSELSSQSFGGLAAGQSKSAYFSLNPSALGKVFKLWAMADPNNDANESEKSNNSRYLIVNRLLNVICYSDSDPRCQYPNLGISGVSISNAVFERQSLKSVDIQVTVKNSGTRDSEGFSMTLYRDSLLNPLKSASVPGLAVSATRAITYHYSDQNTTILSGGAEGGESAFLAGPSTTFYVFIDANGSVIETNKDDNIKLIAISFSESGQPLVSLAQSYTQCDPVDPKCFKEETPATQEDQNRPSGQEPAQKPRVWRIRMLQAIPVGETQTISVADENGNLLIPFHAAITLPDGTLQEYEGANGTVSFKALAPGTYSVLATGNAVSISAQFRALDVFGSVQQSIFQGTEIIFGSAQRQFAWIPLAFMGSEVLVIFLSAYVTNPPRFNPRLRKSKRRKIARLCYVLGLTVLPLGASALLGAFAGFGLVVLEAALNGIIIYIKEEELRKVSEAAMAEEAQKEGAKPKETIAAKLPEGQLVVKTGPEGKVIYYMEPGPKPEAGKTRQRRGLFEGLAEELFGSVKAEGQLLKQRLRAVQSVKAQPPKEAAKSKAPPQVQIIPAVPTGQEEIDSMKTLQLQSMRAKESAEDLKKIAGAIAGPVGKILAKAPQAGQPAVAGEALPVQRKEEEILGKAREMISALGKEGEIEPIRMPKRETLADSVRSSIFRARKGMQAKPEIYSRYDEMISDIEQQLSEIEREKATGKAALAEAESPGEGLALVERQLEEAGYPKPASARERKPAEKKRAGILAVLGAGLFRRKPREEKNPFASGRVGEAAQVSLANELGFRLDASKAIFAIEGKKTRPDSVEGNSARLSLAAQAKVLARVDGYVDTVVSLKPGSSAEARMPYTLKVSVVDEAGKPIDNAYVTIVNAKFETIADTRGNVIWVTPTPSNAGSGAALIPISPRADDRMALMLKVLKAGFKEVQLVLNPNADPVGEISFKRQLEKTVVLSREEEEQ